MAKNIKVKGVSFNLDSKHHVEVLEWTENQSKNFSSFVRELIVMAYNRSKNKSTESNAYPTYEFSNELNNDFDMDLASLV